MRVLCYRERTSQGSSISWMNETSKKTGQELYSLLGEFTVEFERVCLLLRENIAYLSILAGNKEDLFVRTLCAEMGAKSLLTCFRSIAVTSPDLSPGDLKVISSICKQIDSLINERNELLHATWFAPSDSVKMETLEFLEGMKLKHTAIGMIKKPLTLSPEKFEPLIYKCQYLAFMLIMYSLALSFGKIEANFILDSKGKASLTNLEYGSLLDNLVTKDVFDTE